MAQRRHHYERAFEAYLRERRIPYISVDEARKALLPGDAELNAKLGIGGDAAPDGATARALKSFDFVIYTPDTNLLIDVKGRRIPRRASNGMASGHLESWVTQDDVDSLHVWESLFGAGFASAFVFLYQCDAQPPDALFQEIFEDGGRWYAVRAIRLDDYAAHLRVRSPRWRTVHLRSADFERLSGPLYAAVGV